MARKPSAENVAIACAVVAFVVLFSAFVGVSCASADHPQPVGNPLPAAPTPTVSGSSYPPPPYTFNLTPVPLVPESSTRPRGSRFQSDGGAPPGSEHMASTAGRPRMELFLGAGSRTDPQGLDTVSITHRARRELSVQ